MTDETGQTTDPKTDNSSGEESKETSNDSSLKLPEKLQGKSPGEIANMYLDLEKKLGDTSKEVSDARQLQKDMGVVLDVIYSDPDLYKAVKGKLNPTEQKSVENQEDKKTDEPKVNPNDDVRKFTENKILADFENTVGLNKLDKDQRGEAWKKIAANLAEIVDPSGSKTVPEVISSIPLDKLPKFLDNAYFIANKDQVISQARQAGAMKQNRNDSAIIGSISSSSGTDEGASPDLSLAERSTAGKLGMTEQEYIDNKDALDKQRPYLDREE